MQMVEGRCAYDLFLENTPADVLCQLDVYWAKVGGQDPVALIKKYGKRMPLLHMKDGCGGENAPKEPMLALGEGIMDFPAIVKAATQTELFIVELDRCATDMFEAVRKSYQYLAGLVK
jgi:sugar phosphate isomerase/epimerase